MIKKVNEPLADSKIYFHTPTPQAKTTFLYPLCLGHFKCDERYFVSRNSYDSFLLMYIKSGTGYIGTDDLVLPFAGGDFILIDCYAPHSYGASEDLEFCWLHFDGIYARPYYEFLTAQGNYKFTPALPQLKAADKIFLILLEHFSSEQALAEIQLGKYITDLLTAIAPIPEPLSTATEQMILKNNSTAAACERAKVYMRQHFTQPLTIPDLAKHVSLSTYYFINCFRKLFGITPHRYLLEIRLESAKFYLRTSDKSIKDIAFTCGFQSENHFCIAFKKQAGITPTCYRNNI